MLDRSARRHVLAQRARALKLAGVRKCDYCRLEYHSACVGVRRGDLWFCDSDCAEAGADLTSPTDLKAAARDRGPYDVLFAAADRERRDAAREAEKLGDDDVTGVVGEAIQTQEEAARRPRRRLGRPRKRASL